MICTLLFVDNLLNWETELIILRCYYNSFVCNTSGEEIEQGWRTAEYRLVAMFTTEAMNCVPGRICRLCRERGCHFEPDLRRLVTGGRKAKCRAKKGREAGKSRQMTRSIYLMSRLCAIHRTDVSSWVNCIFFFVNFIHHNLENLRKTV